MVDDLQITIERLADIFNLKATSLGISLAYARLPSSLTTTPAVCFFVGQQLYSPYIDSEDLKLEKTLIVIRLYEDHIQQGTPGEVEERLKTRIPLIRDLILSRPGLSLDATHGPLDGVKRAVLERSSGIHTLMYAEEIYAGIEWMITVERIIEVIYADHE